MKTGLLLLRFDTPARRFVSWLLLTGVPFFAIRCFMRREQVMHEPMRVVFIAMRDLVETVILWALNEMLVRSGSRRKR